MVSRDVSLDSLCAFLKPLFFTALSILRSILKHNVDYSLECQLNWLKNWRTKTDFYTIYGIENFLRKQNKMDDEQKKQVFKC